MRANKELKNSNILLCRRGKGAKKNYKVLVLLSQILIYYCEGKRSEQKNSNILLCMRANKELKNFK